MAYYVFKNGEHEFRYIASKVWIKIVCFVAVAAFFFGAEFGKVDTALGYKRLISHMPHACQESFEKIVAREIPQ